MYEAALVLSVISLLGVAVYFARMPAFSVFHPLSFYLLFHAFIFVFRPIVAYIGDFQFIYRVYQFTPSYEDKLTVILASNLGMLAFAFFSLQSGHNPMRFKQDAFAVAERNRLVATAMWALAICVPIGAYSLQLSWNRAAADFSTMVMDAGTGTFMNTSGNGYLAEAQLMLATCCAMVGWLFRFRLLALLPLAAFFIFKAGTGGRGPFVSAAVCLGLLYLYEHRQKIPSPRVIALSMGVLALFTVIGIDRGEAIRSLVSGSDVEEVDFQASNEKWLEGMDFGNLEYFEYLVYAVPQRTGSYEYFADNLMLFTEPVPRVLWPGKPAGPPIKFFELFDYGFPIGMTRSLPGEGWTQLGWLGVIIWCGLWGLGLGTLYQKFTNSSQTTFVVMGYMILMSILVVAFRDGTIITVMRQGIFYFAPILFWKFLADRLGVPLAATLRTAALRKLRMATKASTGTAPDTKRSTSAPTPDSQLTSPDLPPAVIRRRMRLLAMKQAQEA